MAKSLRWLLFLIFINGACNKCYASADPCESISAPTPVSTLLGKSYQGWRIENLSDLDSANQAAWTKKYPGACPGFVKGHFQKPGSVGYAFLLLPAEQTKKGYRLVVFLETARDHWRSIVLEKNDEHTPETTVIGLAAPGDYQEAQGSKKIHIETDAIFSEDMGVGVMIYYWRVDRFRSLVITD